ncbi:MAG: hypothetical protein IIB03_09250, partial [Acidobacteria bacterium]|nr:hypothetical protein [Acidobacteriota bacterium]
MGRLWSSLGTEEDLLLSLSRTLHLKTAVWMWQAVLVAMVVLSLSGPALAQAESIAESCVLLTQPLQLSDDDSRLFLFPSGFSFPFFGTTYTEVWINSDGNLTFGGEDAASTFRTEERFLTGLPRIAPLFTDLNPQEAGEITAVSGPGLVSFIWRNVPQFSAQRGRPGNDFAVTLFSNGDIVFEYSLISLTPDGSGTRAVVGITPGGGAFGSPLDLSERPFPTRLGSDPIYEVFSLSSVDLEFSDVLFLADENPFVEVTFGLDDFHESEPFFLGFSFPFMGNTYDEAVINSDGNLTFGGADDANTFINEERFLSGLPRIAPLFVDLNPGERGVVSAEQGLEYVTFKWIDVPERSFFGGGGLGNTFAVTLRSNGDILFEYGAISVPHAVVGISPGDSVPGSSVVLSNQRLPISTGSDPIYEVTFAQFDQSLIFSIDERAPAELTADPNPIQVCDGSGVGQTTLSWSAPGVNATEIRIGELNGQPFTSGGSTGSESTGRWVQNGMVFCLVDSFAGVALASVVVSLTDSGCTAP